MDAREVGIGQRDLADRRPRPVTMLITPGGSPPPPGVASCSEPTAAGSRRLPDHRVAHQRGSGREVGGDRGEVERGDGQHEALERAVVQPVPHPGPLSGCCSRISRAKATLKRQKSVICTPRRSRPDAGLALTEHGRRVERGPPRAGQQIRRLEEDRGPVVERHPLPRRAADFAAATACRTSAAVASPSVPTGPRLCGCTTSMCSPAREAGAHRRSPWSGRRVRWPSPRAWR